LRLKKKDFIFHSKSEVVEKTGKPIDEWIKIVLTKESDRHSEIVTFLKRAYSMTYG